VAGLFVTGGGALGFVPPHWRDAAAGISGIAIAVLSVLKPVQKPSGVLRPVETPPPGA
jgi:hypothetical protein